MRAHNFKSKCYFDTNMEGGYAYHYAKAREEFIDWYYKSHPNQEYNTLRSMMLDACEMIDFDDELQFALESFDECEQVKILYHYEIHEHCLKIKWEHSPWWRDQVLHFYYCVMLPLDNIRLETPSQLIADKLGEDE